MNETTKRLIGVMLLVFGLMVTIFPRFNRHDIGPIKRLAGHSSGQLSLGDAPFYSSYVEYFRGNCALGKVDIPFRFRFLGPLIASRLPIKSPMTAINVLNILALYVCVLFLFILFKSLGFEFWYSLIGCFIFTISFPVFYFGSDGCIDPQIICIMAVGTYILFNQKWWYLIPIIAIGTMIKETVIILAPVVAVYFWIRNKPWKIKFITLILAFGVPYALIRIILGQSSTFVWQPHSDIILRNLRPRTFLGLALSFGLPGMLAIVYGVKYKAMTQTLGRETSFPLITGIIFSILLVLYSLIAAYTDGRFIWPSNIFALPIGIAYLREINNRRMRISKAA
jgi:hypothetical protein